MKEEIYNLIPNDRYITRKEIQDLTGLKDRLVRKYIAEIRKEYNIISLSSGKGYMKPKHTDNITHEEKLEMLDIIKHQLKENNSIIKNIKKSMRMEVAYLKVIEKSLKIF